MFSIGKKKRTAPAPAGQPAGAAGRLRAWLTSQNLLKLGICTLFFGLFAAALFVVNRPGFVPEPTSFIPREFAIGRVINVLWDDAVPDETAGGRRIGKQTLEFELVSGPHRGAVLRADNYLSAYYNVDLKQGGRATLRIDTDRDGVLYIIAVVNYDRALVMGLYLLGFAALLVLIGGRRGVMALLGLLFTLVTVWFLLIPLIRKGVEPLPITILLVAVTATVALLLLSGFTRRTLCATLGSIGGVTAAGLSAAIVGAITPLNGFNMNEAEDIMLRSDSMVSIGGLLAAGILIASLGGVIDVAITITSAVGEIHTLNPQLRPASLFRSGMNIGRDAMAATTNTLILAFAGAALNTLVLLQLYGYPTLQIINSDYLALEMIQGLSGAMGIMLTVPLVAFISAHLLAKER